MCVLLSFKLPLLGRPLTTPQVWVWPVVPYVARRTPYASLKYCSGTVQCSATQCQHHRMLACLTYTVHSVVVCMAHRSRAPGATSSPKPNFHNDSSGSAELGNANNYTNWSVLEMVYHIS